MQKELQSETTNKSTTTWMIIDITEPKNMIYWNNFSYEKALEFVNTVLKEKNCVLVDTSMKSQKIALPVELVLTLGKAIQKSKESQKKNDTI